MELVDTKDLKSFGHCGRAGSSPASGTVNKVITLDNDIHVKGYFYLAEYYLLFI